MLSFAFHIRVLNDKKEGYFFSKNVDYLLRSVCEKLGIELRNAESYNSPGIITNQIKEAIERADVIIADAASSNENVWYEIGYADRIDENKVILLAPKGHLLPFDRSHVRSFIWDRENIEDDDRIREAVSVAMTEIVGANAVRRMLHLDHPASKIPEYLSRRPSIVENAIRKLQDISTDVEESGELRRRALNVLARLDRLDEQTLFLQTDPMVNEEVRIEIFDMIAQINEPISEEIWNNGLEESRSVGVMRVLARASAHHYLRGNFSDEWYFSNFLGHPRWEIRKHITIALLKSFDDSNISSAAAALRKLASDNAEEVGNRLREWLRAVKERGRDLSGEERAVCVAIFDGTAGADHNWAKDARRTAAEILGREDGSGR